MWKAYNEQKHKKKSYTGQERSVDLLWKVPPSFWLWVFQNNSVCIFFDAFIKVLFKETWDYEVTSKKGGENNWLLSAIEEIENLK